MTPQHRKYFVGEVTILVLTVELVRTSSIGDVTVELDQPNGDIFHCNFIVLEDLADHIFLYHYKSEEEFNEVCAHVRVATRAFFCQQNTQGLNDAMQVFLPEKLYVVLLVSTKELVILEDIVQKEFW